MVVSNVVLAHHSCEGLGAWTEKRERPYILYNSWPSSPVYSLGCQRICLQNQAAFSLVSFLGRARLVLALPYEIDLAHVSTR